MWDTIRVEQNIRIRLKTVQTGKTVTIWVEYIRYHTTPKPNKTNNSTLVIDWLSTWNDGIRDAIVCQHKHNLICNL